MNKETLQTLVNNGGSCVNLGRTIMANHPDINNWIMTSTSFLSSTCKYNERVYCILNNISSIQHDDDGITHSRFINLFEGYKIKKIPPPKKELKGRPVKFTKLQQFLSRNKTRNSKLYADTAVEGIDFVICPHSAARLSMIKSNYITNILEMTVDAYDAKYPGIQKICNNRSVNIKTGLAQIDVESGLTKHELSTIKAKETLSKIDNNGVSGYQKKGQKTRETHMANIDEYGRNGYRQQAHNRVTTITENGLTIEENSHIKRANTLLITNSSGTGGASKQSKIALQPIIELLTSNNITYYFDDTEYRIKDIDNDRYYSFDLTIPHYFIAIEYQSNAWHANPFWDDNKWNNWTPPRGDKITANESLDYDYTKARAMYKFRNMRTFYVWEDTSQQDVEDILCLMKTQITKF